MNVVANYGDVVANYGDEIAKYSIRCTVCGGYNFINVMAIYGLVVAYHVV